MSENQIYCSIPPAQKKLISKYAKENHWSGKAGSFLRPWFFIICRFCDAGVTPEMVMGNLDKLVQVCRGDDD